MSNQVPSDKINWDQKKFPLLVIVENIHSPANVGLIIRTCEAFGVSEIHFLGPYSNVHSDKFKKAARSAEKYIDIIIEQETEVQLNKIHERGYQIIALEIADQSKPLHKLILGTQEKIALLLGSERHGISPESLLLADHSIHIQQYGRTGSLNVGTALSIALYEITNQLK
ncbi:TrmH family RNA methyltransferase [Portibacter lacus]|uniref:tRNA (Guanosine(18)-2'-O)-methyltransferase n=1 Tax=Portibacter lacus TaxID=1099794 RepID=A0AA37SJG4_9BACT|nr:TrmH family RNA methyltransferase [Portibacter lacus]GLR15676.1 tRNA (guanosine(18)-2'-O)-methyltransferase [Portibacter lacus]